jgi:hypothetical protein
MIAKSQPQDPVATAGEREGRGYAPLERVGDR